MRTTNFLSKETNREIDANGYLLVSDCLLLHDGVMEYSGSELIEGCGSDIIDGVTIDPKRYIDLTYP